MKRRGEITVFFSMLLLCVFGLIGVMLESARTAGARCYLQIAANASVDSLFSGYHRQLWDQYHLFGLEYESEAALAQQLEAYLIPYLSTENWYPMELDSVQTEGLKRMTDERGIYLEEEILAYMKYGIWDELEINPNQGEQLVTFIKEAKSVQKLTSSYQEQSREVWKLERAWNNLYGCREKQRDYHGQAGEQLAEENAAGFFWQAGKLEKELGRIPGLMKAYEKQAERLKEHLGDMEQEYLDKTVDLSGGMQAVMGEELERYRAYIDEDGERRREIATLVSQGEANLLVVEETKKQVNRIEEYLEKREDEEDEEDEEPVHELWEEAHGMWSRFDHSAIRPSGTGDEEKRGWLEQIERLADIGLLELVMPEGAEVSTALLDLEDAPSGRGNQTGQTDKGNLLNRVLVNEYCTIHFSDFTSEEMVGMEEAGTEEAGTEEAGTEAVKALYEVEYLLGGEDNDRDNLEYAVGKILAVREGLNLMHILLDSQKREEARALALVITGAVGLAPLVEVTALFIMGVWALGESAADVKALLAGKKVPLFKSRGDWNLSLEQLLEMGREQGGPERGRGEQGFSYESYLKLLLLEEVAERKYYRMMDVIQMNLKRKQEDFRMEFCAYGMDMKADVRGKHVFFALPFVEMQTGSKEHGYGMGVRTQKAY